MNIRLIKRLIFLAPVTICNQNLFAQVQSNATINIRLGLLNYDIGAEVKLSPKQSLYPYFGFGHSLVFNNEKYYFKTIPSSEPWFNFGFFALHAGLEYRFYFYDNKEKISKVSKQNNGLFIGFKSKYNFGQFEKDEARYYYDDNLKLGAGLGYQGAIGKKERLDYELVCYPGIIANRDFSYITANLFFGAKFVIPIWRTPSI